MFLETNAKMSRLLKFTEPLLDTEIDDDINHMKQVWQELGREANVVNQLEEEITNEIVVLVRNKIKKIKAREDHTLRKHRVEVVRSQITDWWLKCRYSDDQKATFRPFSSEVYTDELLRIHQEELEFLKKYHQDNLVLFEMVDQYLALNERHLFLLAQDKNPNRLFENRGGQLLKDERDRKTAKKELPKMEKKITESIAAFETKYKRPFLIEGKTFTETLAAHTYKCNENIEAANEQNVAEVKARVGSAMKRKIPLAPNVAGPRQSKSARKAPANAVSRKDRKFTTLNMG